MCVAFAVAGRDFRFAATDLGFNIYLDGERIARRVDEGRLTWTGNGWIVGSGEGRTISWAFDEIADPTDEEDIRRAMRAAGQRAREYEHDPDHLRYSTHVLSADPEGIVRYSPDGETTRKGAGSYYLLTPPDLPEGAPEALNRRFATLFDPADVDTVLPGARAVLEWVAANSEVTLGRFSIGLLRRDRDGWKHRRLDLGEV